MAAFSMWERALADVIGPHQFNRDQLLRWKSASRETVNTVGAASRRLLSVLIVDDEQESADTLIRLVRGWGHAARLAGDDVAALRMAAAQLPDVVLLDIEMPLDGCQIARQLRLGPRRNECLIIAVTERADDEHRFQCSEAGIDLVLIKPVDPSILETLLMLECEHANRPRADTSAIGASMVVPVRPPSDQRLKKGLAPMNHQALASGGTHE